VYSARDRVENEEWVARLQQTADRLELGSEARTCAEDMFLSSVPEDPRSKRATMAASLYAAGVVAGDHCSQSAVAEAADVARLTVQQNWRELVAEAGFEPPEW
jgi:transcription initiation factor TFIIIB Brf1 subunit/transcription initiation factor TFIIB